MKYERRPKKPAARLAEPVQVYLQPADRERLERLAERLDATKSDVLRRGLEALEAMTSAASRKAAARVELPVFTGGNGVGPGVNLDSNAELLDLMDEEDYPAVG